MINLRNNVGLGLEYWMCGVQIVVTISNFENNFKFKFHPKLYWKFTESIFSTFIFTSTCLVSHTTCSAGIWTTLGKCIRMYLNVMGSVFNLLQQIRAFALALENILNLKNIKQLIYFTDTGKSSRQYRCLVRINESVVSSPFN